MFNEHWNEGYVTKPPLFVQKVLFGALAAVGRVLGYKAHYLRYSGPEEPLDTGSEEDSIGVASTTKMVSPMAATIFVILALLFLLPRNRQ